ncbi:MAG: bifunctional diaminohydroxyphosphoribosylaminopyrimidine deaminase/5-amino-6-(5-phosphoribosylamino)uracil reductase RibD [Elusimicrobiota bacterium]
MKYTKQDKKFMNLALSLAKRGKNRVFPNPMVGCVLVKGGKVVGKGWHGRFGGPHAEINALRLVGANAEGADMYITLEPCNHHGKTPPCTDAIIEAGINKVYAAMKDPNPMVAGQGLKKLSSKGVKTAFGLLENQARALNCDYLNHMKNRKPEVIIKVAMTLDGKIASHTGDSKWISGPKSRGYAHKLRSQVDGVLVGIGTVLKDNPRLTSHGKGRNPVRIVVDPGLCIPINSRILDKSASTIVFHGPHFVKAKLEALKKIGIIACKMPLKNGVPDFKDMISKLNNMCVNSILIEGGGETVFSALKAKIADSIIVFVAPKLLGGRNAKTPMEGQGFSWINQSIPVRNWKVRRFGPDIMIEGRIHPVRNTRT